MPRILKRPPPQRLKSQLGRIPVAFCFDERIWKHATVSLVSLVKTRGKSPVDIYCVVPDKLGPRERKLMRDVIVGIDKESSVNFVSAPLDFEGRGFTALKRWGTATFFRLMLARILPQLDEVLCIDIADVIFNGPLDELWATRLDDNLIAAVFEDKEEPDSATRKIYRRGKEILDLKRSGKYFCAGVAKQNLKAIRNEKLMDEFLDLFDRAWPFVDQDILNMTCKGRALSIDRKYGMLPVADGSVIIHYSGPQKPWHFATRPARPDEMLWWHYALMTPFAEDFLTEYRTKAIGYASSWRIPRLLCNFICFFIPGKPARDRFRQSHSLHVRYAR